MSWLIHTQPFARAVASQVQAVQRLVTPSSLRRARAGVLRVITVVAGH